MNETRMTTVSAWRALVRTVRRRAPAEDGPTAPPVFWGRIGAYEAVSRRGMLFLLDPQPAHPSLRARSDA